MDTPPPKIDPECFVLLNRLKGCLENISDDTRSDLHVMCKREADTDFIKKQEESLNMTLIFAGLLSAVTSAFVIDVRSKLEPNYDERSEAYLRAILLTLDRSNSPGENPAAPPAWNGPPAEIVAIQGLLYASLITSLLSALIAMLGKQWLNWHLRNSGGLMVERCGDRQRKCGGPQGWPFRFLVESPQVMLQAAPLLLICGLWGYMWTVNASIAYTLITITGPGVLFYSGIMITGMPPCQYPLQIPAFTARRSSIKKTSNQITSVSLSIVIRGLDLPWVLSSTVLRLWGVVKGLTASAIPRFKQDGVLMTRNLHQWVRQGTYYPPEPASLDEIREDLRASLEPNSSLQGPILEISQDRNGAFESLRHTLSSRGERELLYRLPIGEAVAVIDVLEQGLREDSPLCDDDQKRISMVLRKMCHEHKRLPLSYTTTDDLEWSGEYPVYRGGYADVWRGAYRGSQVAIKVLRVSVGTDLVNLERKFCREVVIWKQFKHPNLLPLVSTKTTPQTLMMISEWMGHGTIMEFINARPETNRLKLLADIARGLKYLHEWPSVHADLKSSNVLIDSSHSARIADFGLTSLLRHPWISVSVSAPARGGTYQWMAPELFDENSRPSRESDIYAFGMVIYEVFAHERPFSRVSQFLVHRLVLAGERPPRPTNRDILGLSEEVWALIEQCWDRIPSDRPHIADILALFEAASRDWASQTPEAIANLNLGRSTRQLPSITESADIISGFI